MRVAARVVVVLATFLFVGWATQRAVLMHAVAGGAPGAEVRLARLMAGLFAGGAAALLTAIALLWKRS